MRTRAQEAKGMRKIILAIIALVLFMPATAAADYTLKHPHREHCRHGYVRRGKATCVRREEPIQAATRIASAYWHTAPCSGHVNVIQSLPLANDELEPGGDQVSMWSRWDAESPLENVESAPQPFINCTVGINPTVWTSEHMEAYTAWPEFVASFVHEWGHLLGHGHSTDPSSIMYPDPSAKAQFGETAPGWTS